MQIKLSSVFVDDQDKALAFYTDRLGFQKKAEFPAGDFKWLTVVSPEDPNGTELVLASNQDPAEKALQKSLKERGIWAANFYTNDVQGDYDRISAAGVNFTSAPTQMPWGTYVVLDDTCGNLIQITQFAWQG
jgi:predicted enzyme related to lactoylglutathione lyase